MLLGLSFELGNKKLPELHQSVIVEGPNPPIPHLPSPVGLLPCTVLRGGPERPSILATVDCILPELCPQDELIKFVICYIGRDMEPVVRRCWALNLEADFGMMTTRTKVVRGKN